MNAENNHAPIAPTWPTKRERAARVAAKPGRALCNAIIAEARNADDANHRHDRRDAALFAARAVVAAIRKNVDDYYADRVTYERFSARNGALWVLADTQHAIVCALLRDDHQDVDALVNAIE